LHFKLNQSNSNLSDQISVMFATKQIKKSEEFMTTAVGVATMKGALVTAAGAGLRIVELEIPEPGPGQVRIKVQACGVCRSDAIIVEGRRPGIAYPRVPGHEVAGVVDALGDGVTEWRKGQRVGVGWHGGHDGTCPECRRGDFRLCRNEKNPGLSYDGGYQEYMLAPVEALVSIPDGLRDVDVAPLLCAGSNTYNALRRSGALAGDLIAVQGIGGLGHLGIQFANKLGYKVAAIGRGSQIELLTMKLGADVYIDTKVKNVAEELQKLGGARVIIATAPDSKAITDLIGGLGPNGKLLIIGVASNPIEVTPVQLIRGGKSIEGWAGVTPADSDDTLRFAELRGVRAMIETYPLEKAAEAYARMMSGMAEFRVVLTM
jgi:D-arabinose 1-dehydrogenase-like Zn-dependent alcohol dehydrogenase